MMYNPTNRIPAKEAENIIALGTALSDVAVDGTLNIEDPGCIFKKELTIENCVIENMNCINIMFHKPVTIRNSNFKEASFIFSYFHGGLTIDNCKFDKYLDFEAGGHNDPGSLYLIKNSEFLGFVNFNDCWFTGDVSILGNVFHNGTNIASKEQYITLDGKLTVENNLGQTNIDDDCRVAE